MKDFSWVDVQYPKKLRELHNDLEFLPERMKIEKIEKLVTNLHEKTEYAIHIRNLKQALNHGLTLKKVHTVTRACFMPSMHAIVARMRVPFSKIVKDFDVLHVFSSICTFLGLALPFCEKNCTLASNS